MDPLCAAAHPHLEVEAAGDVAAEAKGQRRRASAASTARHAGDGQPRDARRRNQLEAGRRDAAAEGVVAAQRDRVSCAPSMFDSSSGVRLDATVTAV